MKAGPAIIQEAFRTSFDNPAVMRRYLILPVVLGLTLTVTWPRMSLTAAIATGAVTDTLLWVGLGLLFSVLYLNVRLGAEEYSPEAASHVRDYATLTPVSLVSVVAGKFFFGALHTLFFTALGAPFLVAAISVCGAEWVAVGETLAVIAAAGLAARLYGLLLLSLTGRRLLVRSLAAIPGVTAFLVLTFAFAPDFNPPQVLADIARGASAPGVAFSVITSLALAVLFAVCTVAVLHTARRAAARERERHG